MNNAAGALNFNAVLNLDEWNRNIEKIKRDLLDLNNNTKKNTNDMNSAFKNLSVGIASYFSVHMVKDFIMELINVRGEFQQMENAIETITGSTQVMNGLMDEWKELTLRSPFRLSEIGQAGKQLLAYGISVDKVTHDIEMLGNVAAGVSAPIGDIAYVYGTLKTQGRAYTRDILQFTMRGIPIMGELAKVMGVSTSEMKGLIEAGKVGFPEVEKAMNALTSEGGKFNNLIGKQATTLTGSVNRLKHEFELMLNDIGTANEGILKGGIDAVTHLIENYQEVGRVLLTLIEIYGVYKTALVTTQLLQSAGVTIEAIKTWIALARSIRSAADAQALFNLTTSANGYVLIITAIAAVIAITYNYRKELGELLGVIDDTTNAQKAQEEVMNEYHLNFSKGVYQTKATIAELINTIRNESSTMDMRKAAYERLIKIDGSFRDVLDGQYKATKKLGEALEFVTQKIDAFAMAQAKASASKKLLEQSFEAQYERDAVRVQIEAAKANAKKWRDLDVEARKKGKASLVYLQNAVKYDQEVAKLEKSLVEKVKVANDRTGVSNAVIRQNNKQVDDATKSLNKVKQQIAEYKKLGKDVSGLEKSKEKLENFLNGFRPVSLMGEEEAKPVEGWAEKIKAQIDALEIEASKAPNQAAYLKIKARIKQLNELLNPPKGKQDNKQFAEIIPEDSVKALERNAQLMSDAIDVASNGMVKLRKLDKYGNDKDKKGNPLLTGEIIPVEEAYKRLQAIRDEIEDRKFKTSQEKLEDSKKLWEQYYQVAEVYGKETADAQYSALFSGSQNYLQYVEKEIQKITDRLSAGEKLTKSDKAYFTMLQTELKALDGTQSYMEIFQSDIEDAIKLIPSLVDQIEYLEKVESDEFKKTGNTDQFLNKRKYLQEYTRNVIQQQKDQYAEFAKEHENFEQRKLEVEKKYDAIRKQIQASKNSDAEKARLTAEANKDQAKDISGISLELFQKTDLWVKAFGDLDKIGPKTLRKIREGMSKFLDSDQAKSLKPEDLKTVQDALIKLDDQIRARNPFQAIGLAVDLYKKKRQELNEVEKKSGKGSDEYQKKLEETNQAFVNIVEVTGAAAKATIEVVGTIGDAFGGLSDDLKQTLAEVQQLIDGIVNTVAGYFSGNYGQMISGIVQIVGSVVKLLSGDKGRERQIQSWQRAVEDLKTSYDELSKSIERTAGEASLAMNRALIENLQEQKRLLTQMREEEQSKKKADQDKITSFNSQISQINQQIDSVMDNFKKNVTTTDFKELSQTLADALIEAFGKGEDAANSFEKVVDDVMRNAVANALRIKILEPAVQKMVDSLYSSMGYGTGNPNVNNGQIKAYQDQIAEIEKQIKFKEEKEPANAPGVKDEVLKLKAQRQKLLDLIGQLQAQAASTPLGGNFDGLTDAEREEIKLKGLTAMQQYTAALEQYKDLFGESSEAAQGLKGDIKGITEKTAGALEGQINAMRINVAEALKIHRENQFVFKNQLLQLTQIEVNTRNLVQIRKDMSELNSKVKYGAAGIP